MIPTTVHRRRAFVFALFAGAWTAGRAAEPTFAKLPTLQARSAPLDSQAPTEKAYRKDAGAHFYSAYPAQVYYGKLPPLLYAIAVTETEVDAQGAVLNVRIKRAPAGAKHVGPWVADLIRRAAPLPPPVRMGRVRFIEIWLVDRSGRFQVDSLTEGQL
jgi:protein TonB